MATTKRIRRLMLVLLLALGGAAGVCGWLAATGRVGVRTPPNLITLYGNVDIRQVELGFRVAGRLQSMRFEEGERLSTGALMATLDPRPFDDDVRGDAADVAAQDATLRKLVSGSRPEEIGRARAAVDEARAGERNARTELGRSERLVAHGAIPHETYDNSLAASQQANARVASAHESYRLEVQGPRVEDIEAQTATLQVAQARLAAAHTALDDTRLVAPSDGVILSRVREPGAIVSPNDVVYVLSLTHQVWVRAYVAEPQLGKLRPGMEVAVFSDATPRRPYRGHIGFISPTAEFTPKTVETPQLRTDLVYRLRVLVDDADGGLRQGMPVTVRIDTTGA